MEIEYKKTRWKMRLRWIAVGFSLFRCCLLLCLSAFPLPFGVDSIYWMNNDSYKFARSSFHSWQRSIVLLRSVSLWRSPIVHKSYWRSTDSTLYTYASRPVGIDVDLYARLHKQALVNVLFVLDMSYNTSLRRTAVSMSKIEEAVFPLRKQKKLEREE